MKIHVASLAMGAVLGSIVVFSIAAASNKPPLPQIQSPRFVVIDIQPQEAPPTGRKMAALRLARFYGKIDGQSLDFHLEHETQELKLLTPIDSDFGIQTNDIIELQISSHLRLGPGSMAVTHLPKDGSQSK